MTTVSIRLEDDMKAELDDLCAELGMSLSTFFTVYVRKAVRERRIPFELDAPRRQRASAGEEPR